MDSDGFTGRLARALSLPLMLAAIAPAAGQTTKNLVVNGSFDTSFSGWTSFSGNPIASTTWRAADATGAAGSGSARAVLAAGHESGALVLRQCVPVNGAARYATSLRTRSSAPRAFQSVVTYSAWDGPNCDGNFLPGGQLANFGGLTTAWETQHFLLSPPPGTRSYQLDLDVQGGPGAGANTVEYDDVFLGPAPEPPFACVDGPTTLCLDDSPGDRRFQVEARFAVHAPPSADARAINLGGLGVHRGGLFWFFSNDNPELLIKVLNGCAVNQRVWIFAAAGTNVAADVFVLDSSNGAVSWIHNPANRPFPTLQDTGALGCAP